MNKNEPKPGKPVEVEPVKPVKPVEIELGKPEPSKPAIKRYPNGLPYRNYPGDGSDTRRGMNIPMD